MWIEWNDEVHQRVLVETGSVTGYDTAAAGRRVGVRGHLVRRDSCVYWRMPHLRGSGARGMIRSRTVFLSFARPRADRCA
jgi:hypothetical protein